jgi:hypothetical protein
MGIDPKAANSARYQASFVGPDLRRHFAPVTFESKMTAERWLTKNATGSRCAASDEGLSSWKPPEVQAEAVAVADYAKTAGSTSPAPGVPNGCGRTRPILRARRFRS